MGPGSAFYNDYTDAAVVPMKLVKTAQETDSKFVKRCLDSCGSDCNVVKVAHFRLTANKKITGECLKCQEINFEFLRLIKL